MSAYEVISFSTGKTARAFCLERLDLWIDYLEKTSANQNVIPGALDALERDLGLRAERHSAAEFLRLVKAEKDSNPSDERLAVLVEIVQIVYLSSTKNVKNERVL